MSDTASRRAGRTLLQLVAAGGLTALFEQLATDVPASYSAYVLIFSVLAVTIAQNWLEDNGYIAPILGTKPDLTKPEDI